MNHFNYPTNDGEITFTISTAHFIVVEVLYRPGREATLSARETPLLVFAVAGEFIEVDGRQVHGDDGTVLILEANESCSLEFQQEARLVIVTTPTATASIETISLLESRRCLRRSALKPLLRNIWCEARRSDASARLALDGAIFTLLAELLRVFTRPQSPSRLSRSLRLLHSAGDEAIGIAELARISGMSVHAFAYAFKEETGATFVAYRRRLRVERAKELLRQTARSAREIGLAVGFSDYGHFSRVFTRYAGMSPADYRRVHDGMSR